MQCRWFLAFALLVVTACGKDDGDRPSPGASAVHDGILYSPNAEPLSGGARGMPDCRSAEGAWFDRLDASHSGTIGRAAFLDDARAQFLRMDIDKNGFLVSEELTRYRDPYRIASVTIPQKPEKDQARGKKRGGKDKKPAEGNLTDPVMAADANLDFKVTPEEWMKQAQEVFARLDTNHDGALSRGEVEAFCD